MENFTHTVQAMAENVISGLENQIAEHKRRQHLSCSHSIGIEKWRKAEEQLVPALKAMLVTAKELHRASLMFQMLMSTSYDLTGDSSPEVKHG